VVAVPGGPSATLIKSFKTGHVRWKDRTSRHKRSFNTETDLDRWGKRRGGVLNIPQHRYFLSGKPGLNTAVRSKRGASWRWGDTGKDVCRGFSLSAGCEHRKVIAGGEPPEQGRRPGHVDSWRFAAEGRFCATPNRRKGAKMWVHQTKWAGVRKEISTKSWRRHLKGFQTEKPGVNPGIPRGVTGRQRLNKERGNGGGGNGRRSRCVHSSLGGDGFRGHKRTPTHELPVGWGVQNWGEQDASTHPEKMGDLNTALPTKRPKKGGGKTTPM